MSYTMDKKTLRQKRAAEKKRRESNKGRVDYLNEQAQNIRKTVKGWSHTKFKALSERLTKEALRRADKDDRARKAAARRKNKQKQT